MIKRKRILSDEEYEAQHSDKGKRPTASATPPDGIDDVDFPPSDNSNGNNSRGNNGDNGDSDRGRPTPYTQDHARIARQMCELGATDIQLADAFGVDVSTIYNWRINNREFFDACMAGKEGFDQTIVRSLAQRAAGYDYEEEVTKVVPDGNDGWDVVRYRVRKHMPPDPRAASWWLKNRKPEEWRDRHEITGANAGPIKVMSLDPAKLANLSLSELAVLEKAMEKVGGMDTASPQETIEADPALYERLLKN